MVGVAIRNGVYDAARRGLPVLARGGAGYLHQPYRWELSASLSGGIPSLSATCSLDSLEDVTQGAEPWQYPRDWEAAYTWEVAKTTATPTAAPDASARTRVWRDEYRNGDCSGSARLGQPAADPFGAAGDGWIRWEFREETGGLEQDSTFRDSRLEVRPAGVFFPYYGADGSVEYEGIAVPRGTWWVGAVIDISASAGAYDWDDTSLRPSPHVKATCNGVTAYETWGGSSPLGSFGYSVGWGRRILAVFPGPARHRLHGSGTFSFDPSLAVVVDSWWDDFDVPGLTPPAMDVAEWLRGLSFTLSAGAWTGN